MNRIARLIVTALIAAMALVAAPAQAAPAEKGHSCRHVNSVNMLAGSDDQIDHAEALTTTNVFREFRCDLRGMRLYKMKYNTAAERSSVRRFVGQLAKDNDYEYPILLCETGRDRGHVIDLAYYWFARIERISALEKRVYASWAERYAGARGCKTFR